MKKQVYLDYAAATPLDPSVIKAMAPYFADNFYNPSAIYLGGRTARQALEKARATIARNLGAKPAEIVFTAGATEANNLAIQGVMRSYPDGEILVSAIEHESVLGPAGLFKCREIPVDQNGRVVLKELEKMINTRTVLISVGLVNNEIGTTQSLKDISNLLKAVKIHRERIHGASKLPLYLHTDAAQAPSYFDLHVSRLGVDLLTINGAKIYGPKQSGALYIKAGTKLQPLILGGGQESNLRSGTENVAAAIGLATVLDKVQQARIKEFRRVASLRELFLDGLAKIPGASVNGSQKYVSPHIVSVKLAGHDNERLMMELDERGVQVAVGSACSALRQTAQGSASGDKPSHVLSAIGLSDEEARSTLRFSFGRQTTKPDIETALRLLRDLTS
ncbi:cysteine desulfurase [Candidatus Saccharibacteria bacterium]|nr:cysteine desulfurase [Candidatus Saccharibacteria bacterium]